MPDPGGNLRRLREVAVDCLERGTLRTYWPRLTRETTAPAVLTRGVAAVVWVVLLPIVPLLAARRRRLIARALEAVVRSIVAGVEVPTAVDRGVAWLEGKGVDRVRARTDLERKVAGFLSGPSASAAPVRREAG